MGFYNIPIYAALLCIIARLLLFSFGSGEEQQVHYIRMLYLLVMLIALAIGVILNRKAVSGPLPTFSNEVKASMKVAGVFTLIMAVFTYVFYRFIHSGYFQERIIAITDAAKGRTEQELENIRATAEFVFSPFTHATATLFIGLVIGFFYSLLLVALMRLKPGAKV